MTGTEHRAAPRQQVRWTVTIIPSTGDPVSGHALNIGPDGAAVMLLRALRSNLRCTARLHLPLRDPQHTQQPWLDIEARVVYALPGAADAVQTGLHFLWRSDWQRALLAGRLGLR